MKKPLLTPRCIPRPYEAPDCTVLATESSGIFCASGEGQNEAFDETIYLFETDIIKYSTIS